ncbi:MAG: class I SAM-dependent methyltransferase [Myxococcales bacterium]|nr:class I SAM-dependent methyltransferase [Myxococcota bacterium]MDW8283154.1 class I SAM-dependent methyltransferase [Myxococcales bacterium]
MLARAVTHDVGSHARGRYQRFRALRHVVADLGVGPLSASAWHGRLHALGGTCDNVSLHGLLLRLPGQAGGLDQVAIDDPVTGLHVTLQTGEVVCHGNALVRHARAEGDDLLLGLALLEGVVDLPLLHAQHTRRQFSARCDEAERAADLSRIRPAFKQWLADLRHYLETMQAFLDREEEALRCEDRFTREQICAQYLAEVGPRVVEKVHQASRRLADIVGDLTDEEHALHRAYGQRQLGALFATSPFMRRAWEKPLGYAGDYEMMNMLYRPPEEGSTFFGKVMNLCWMREVAARANVNRISYLGDLIRGVILAQQGQRARLVSVGCGPAREVEVLLEREPELGPRMEVTLIDQDPRAISYCERKLTPLAERTGARMLFMRESVRRLLTAGSLLYTLGPRDLIYSAGLFDYLSERSFVALLSSLYDAIAPGGRLVVGNIDISNPSRYLMEYFGEWFLIHRSAPQLLDKVRLLRPTPRQAHVEAEPLGVNLFLVIEK